MAEHNPDPAWIEYQNRMNDENIRTLVILHRVYAGFMGLFSCCFGAYFLLIVGVAGMASASPKSDNPPPPGLFAFMAGIWGFLVAGFVAVLILNLLCANWLRDRRNWVGVIVASGFNCLTGVLGIGLAVFTLIVVNRPAVRSTFQ